MLFRSSVLQVVCGTNEEALSLIQNLAWEDPRIQPLGQVTPLHNLMREADLVITGEGKVDSQVLQGKVVGGCCKGLSAAGSSAMGKRLWLMCGKSEIAEEDLRKIAGDIDVSIFQMADIEPDMKVRMSNEHALMRRLAYLAAKELDGHL